MTVATEKRGPVLRAGDKSAARTKAPTKKPAVPKRKKYVLRQRTSSFESRINPVNPQVGYVGTGGTLWKLFGSALWWLGLPGKWFVQLARLILFTILMLPGFLPSFFGYFTSKQIVKNVVYGPSIRHQLDIYMPVELRDGDDAKPPPAPLKKAPVAIFISGGAWIIGYKAWAWILGILMQRQGVLFISADYRNFPQTSVKGMVQDVIRAVGWVLANIEELGGDPDNVVLMGQSAGAHLTCLALLEQAKREAEGDLQNSIVREDSFKSGMNDDDFFDASDIFKWKTGSLRAWFGISGCYDIESVLPCLQDRGLPPSIIRALMSHDISKSSPVHHVRVLADSGHEGHAALEALPAMHLFHGEEDMTCPWQQSETLANALGEAGVKVQKRYYPGKSHTDIIIEDCASGEQSDLIRDVLQLLVPSQQIGFIEAVETWQPRFMTRWAKIANPF